MTNRDYGRACDPWGLLTLALIILQQATGSPCLYFSGMLRIMYELWNFRSPRFFVTWSVVVERNLIQRSYGWKAIFYGH